MYYVESSGGHIVRCSAYNAFFQKTEELSLLFKFYTPYKRIIYIFNIVYVSSAIYFFLGFH